MITDKPAHPPKKIAALFRTLSQQARIEILLFIGEGETCVCHLEAQLGLRQAYISQHLMAMRKAGIITSRRDGRFIFYQLADKNLLELIHAAAELAGVDFLKAISTRPNWKPAGCACPQCAPQENTERLPIPA